MPTYYMHTINGHAATFQNKQICYACGQAKLVPSLRQIRKERALSSAYRKRRGFIDLSGKCSYILVRIP